MARGRARPRVPILILIGLTLALATGCATVPSGGAPRQLEAQGGQQQAFVQPLPPPAPTFKWTPADVVDGFLAASADFELDPAAARQYLAPGTQWMPQSARSQPQVTVVTGPVNTSETSKYPHLSGGQYTAKVTVTGEQLASLSADGYYSYSPARSTSYNFQLGSYNGIWLIQSPLPKLNLLLLTQTAFEQVFQPRNLYFFAPPDSTKPEPDYLVPDPVFVPLQNETATANATSLATELVQGLLTVNEKQMTWLSSAIWIYQPDDTNLQEPGGVTISDQTATVRLRIRVRVSQAQLMRMYEQLYETLTSSSYSPPIVQRVQLVVNGTLEHFSGLGQAVVPAVGSPNELLYYAEGGLLRSVTPGRAPARISAPYALLAGPQVTVAVSRGSNQLAIAVPTKRGCAVYVGPLGKTTGYRQLQLPPTGQCRSLSWDGGNNLWVVVGSQIWVSQPRQSPVQVDPPSGYPVLAARMAPDGVRAAFLVHTRNGNRMLLAAVTYGTGSVAFGAWRPVGNGLANPSAIAWYKPDDLIAVDGSGLYEVPLTGGTPEFLAQAPAGTESISSGGPGELAALTAAGQIWASSDGGGQWNPVRTGAGLQSGPAYPG
jgi:lipoprotein LpqB-like beta-propeller protein